MKIKVTVKEVNKPYGKYRATAEECLTPWEVFTGKTIATGYGEGESERLAWEDAVKDLGKTKQAEESKKVIYINVKQGD
jgi:hypothetical protein